MLRVRWEAAKWVRPFRVLCPDPKMLLSVRDEHVFMGLAKDELPVLRNQAMKFHAERGMDLR